MSDARKYGTTNPVLIEARINHDPYDEFAWVQDWRWALRDYDSPNAERTYAWETLTSMGTTPEERAYALKILDRYREWLRIAGKDY